MFLPTDIAFRSFFDSFYPTLVHFCQRYIGDADEAEDIAQETFIRLHEKKYDFDHEYKVRAFLYETAKNLCYDLIKHQVVKKKYLLKLQGEKEEEEAFSREMIREEAFALLYAAISQLPLQSRKIIEACLQGRSNKEIAVSLGVAETTVKTLRQNAYRKLRDLLPRHIFVLFFKLLVNKRK